MAGVRTSNAICADGMPAFVAMPESAAKAPAVVVVHERYGLVKHTCDLAQRFACDGYVAIAPDLYFRYPDQDALHRGDAGYDISDLDAVIALGHVIDALEAVPQADLSQLSIMGICQTARLPLVVAASRPIAAALVWYGAAQPREWQVNAKYPRPLDDVIASVDCPVLGMFGETDHLISFDDIRKLRDCLAALATSTSANISVGDLRRQIRRVGRYSFQFGRF